ncbi:hypothetical protein PRN20_18160 [Devosia sp. ZB163]|uniref:hypothetical protein n=1 Tax=Devosia sp. ZB163 TaxID=3025938 RepID=UPI00235F57E2|nr:hypothetical protein [Devosia sp. ZB163]MDC9825662.1 hypothetical protein [Devosia sp. ZB163]
MTSRYKTGGLEPRFVINRADGKAIDPSRRYSLVLDFSGADPHAIAAANAYADSVEVENPELAADIRAALANPANAPAQHGYAS